MKAVLSFFLLLITVLPATAQMPACCVKPVGNNGMAIASSAAFIAAHEPPLPFNFQSEQGSMIRFETMDGKQGNAYYVPAKAVTNKVLILCHEWWGLNDYIKREAVRWQELLGDIDVYAIDMYDGQVATTPEQAAKLSGGLNKQRAENLVKGIVVKAGKDKQIATLGWCMGGSYAFAVAVAAGSQASGCVMYYGFPEKEVKKIKPLKTDVLFIRGTQDQFITGTAIDSFGQEVIKTGHTFQLESYDAVHAFANPSNPKYNQDAAAKAGQVATAFLKKHLELE